MTQGRRGTERTWGIWLWVLAAALVAVPVAAVSAPAEAQTGCGTIQDRVSGASDGGTVDLPDGCVYRETVTIDKPLTLRGGPGVEIRGSDVWGGWTRSGPYWVRGTLPEFRTATQTSDPQHPYPCDDGTKRCLWPAQVFFDGRPLWQAASSPKPGQFSVTADRRVVLADDPSGHEVEVTTRREWVVGEAAGVTIDDVDMRHAANAAQSPALDNNGHDDWTVLNSDLSYAHGTVLGLGRAAGLRVEGSRIHHAGRLGIGSSNADDLEVEDNEIDHNNTEAFYAGFSAGGAKITGANRLVVSGNEIHHNDRIGVWADAGNQDVTFSNNRVHHNPKRGLHLEIADRAKVYGNVLWENGWGEKGGAAISATASRDVEIYDNVLAWNSDGITVVNSQREHATGATDPKYDLVENVRVHDNTILAEDLVSRGPVEDFSKLNLALIWNKAYPEGNIYDPAANNRGYDNRYWYAEPEGAGRYRFLYKKPIKGLDTLNGTLGEEGGRYISDAEKERVVTTNDIPAEPER